MQDVNAAAEGADHAVGVTNGDHRQARRTAGDKPMAVADAASARHLPDQADACLHRQGRLQSQMPAEVVCWGLSVKGETNPHHVQMEAGILQGAGGIGQMAAQVTAPIRQGFNDGSKALQLHVGELIPRLICAGEMAVEAHQVQLRQGADGLHQLGALLPFATKPGHPRIEFQLHRKALGSSPSSHRSGGVRFIQAAQGRHQPPLQAMAEILRVGQGAEDQHRRLNARIPQFQAFLKGGHAQAGCPAA